MTITIRPAEPERDYDAIARLINQVDPQQITADELRRRDSLGGSPSIHRRAVATDAGGQVVGYSTVEHQSWMATGAFNLWLTVDEARRRQGIGTATYEEALDFARQQGATFLSADVREGSPESMRFAEQRGFRVARHIFESTLRLDLAGFDEARFAGLLERPQSQGIRFFSLADIGETDDHLRRLWQVNYETYLDDPGTTGAFPDFEEFCHILRTGAWYRPAGQLLAADGDTFVGLSAVGYFAETNSMYNMMTGVIRTHRGRGIAQALKLLTIRYGLDCGATYIRTNNDSENAAMLAINRKLGYVPEPGIFRMVKTLEK